MTAPSMTRRPEPSPSSPVAAATGREPDRTAAVTGVGAALPGVAEPADLLDEHPRTGAPPVDPGARIGRRGLRYKDRATQLALCAARDALVDAGLLDGGALTVPAASVAVVVSSNLGNLDTVCAATSVIAERTVTGTSPMDLPNASSNVPASSVAIRFGLRGPNLMLCNGPTSGLDAVYWASMLVVGGRADHAVVVGVETRNDVVHRFVGADPDDLLDGSVALVVETAGRARRRGVDPAVVLGRHSHGRGLADCLARIADPGGNAAPTGGGDAPSLWFVPERHEGAIPHPWLGAADLHDVSASFGRASGATGVLQCATAAASLRAGHPGPVVVTAGEDGEAVAGTALWASGDVLAGSTSDLETAGAIA